MRSARPLRPKLNSLRRSVSRQQRPGIDVLESRELLSTFVVTNIADSGVHSLRWAIIQANNNPGADTINFDIKSNVPKVIVLNNQLPVIVHQVTINGYSQPGATPNTLGTGQGTNANLVIEI